MARTKIGQATTDANGVASFTYTGTGAGEIDIIAKTANLESNAVSIDDYAQEVTSMTLTGDKSIIQTGDTATLTATVLDQYGQGIDGEEVVFKIGDTTLDTVTTSDGGVATVSYLGQGTGVLNIRVECMNVTQTYSVMDCIKYDYGTSENHNDIWTYNSSTASMSVRRADTYTEFGELASANIGNATNIASSCIIEFDFYQVDGYRNNNFFQILTSDNSSLFSKTLYDVGGVTESWYHLKISIDTDDHCVFENVTTGSSVSADLTGTVSKFNFWTSGAMTKLRFKDFKVYPL